ncbi:dihydrodipicolinate synthase family protein [Pseudooceanicola sp. CBS1P-1]|uniref:4-hydroxy-tetrahydrodipicolinate synthase n=1 Tax=Pseudooceanicola albus TaxID=2692189 RepID=A0A6L7G713_9RHOB|nr:MULTISPECIES: dihydrodipicolinate synthase family protein [Pseudooceanicola]MBT9384407.1 dihydrodipicolinate synthase family protein [Pseudooceanicola endophyticus]MXN19855.1 4-hydroxy-tetrahydrodipicolinate synthase [Pseudooceanicola albus]
MTIDKSSLEGLFTAIVTPFDADGAVDYPALQALVGRQIAAGASGIVPIGGTGEYPTLTRGERAGIVSACVEAAGGKPVLPGVLATGYGDALEAGRDFTAAGAAGLMLVTPFYAVGPQEGMRAYFARYREAIDVPLMAYEIPRRTNAALTAETYAGMAEDGSIIGMKYSSYDMPTFLAVLREVGDKLAVLSGEEPLFATHVAAGATGGVLASASLFPTFWLEVFRKARSGDLRGALEMQYRVDAALAAIYRETNPGPLKQIMKMAGHDMGGVRLPLTEPSAETMAMLSAVLPDLPLETELA